MRPSKYSKQKIPIFIDKLFSILESEENKQIIDWTDTGDAFIILNLKDFTQNILPRHFKHSNLHSFIRQLNMYNFTKIRQNGREGQADHIYQNRLFCRNSPALLRDIRRKQIIPKKQQSMMVLNRDNVPFSNSYQSLLQEKLQKIKEQHQNLNQICCHLITQNRILLTQNQEIMKNIKKEGRKKDRILQQIFRIVSSTITQQWSEFKQQNGLLNEQVNEKQLFQIVMNFIEQNQLPQIVKTLTKFFNLGHLRKGNNFTIISKSEQANTEENILAPISLQQLDLLLSEAMLIQAEND